jgi:hypothetical protein
MEGTNGRRVSFNVVAVTSPKLLVDAGTRQCVLIFNNTSGNIYLGGSGTVGNAGGLVLPTNTAFWDLFSSDAWWVATPSSSGTVSGFSVL